MAPRKSTTTAPAPVPAVQPTRRSTRLRQAAAGGPAKEAKTRITKPAPAPKPKPQKYDCTTCGRTLAASSFPNHLPTDDCKHPIDTCKVCTKQYITVQLDSTTNDKLSCPQCPEILANADVKRLGTKESYARAGQVHAPLLKNVESLSEEGAGGEAKKKGVTKKKVPIKTKKSFWPFFTSSEESEENDDHIFTCRTCDSRACVTCDRPYHDGETCAQYQKRTDKDEKATQKMIEKSCKPCPKCGKNFEKNGGCDSMVCSQCGTLFCWLCATTYTVINKSGHAKGCRYAQPGRIDPHAMHAPVPAGAPGWFG